MASNTSPLMLTTVPTKEDDVTLPEIGFSVRRLGTVSLQIGKALWQPERMVLQSMVSRHRLSSSKTSTEPASESWKVRP